MKLKKVKGEKPLEDIINHILARMDRLEKDNADLRKLVSTIDGEIGMITEAVFESGPLGEYDA